MAWLEPISRTCILYKQQHRKSCIFSKKNYILILVYYLFLRLCLMWVYPIEKSRRKFVILFLLLCIFLSYPLYQRKLDQIKQQKNYFNSFPYFVNYYTDGTYKNILDDDRIYPILWNCWWNNLSLCLNLNSNSYIKNINKNHKIIILCCT